MTSLGLSVMSTSAMLFALRHLSMGQGVRIVVSGVRIRREADKYGVCVWASGRERRKL